MQDASGKPTQQIKTEKARTAHAVFNIVTKDPEGPHIPDNVHPATMQKHRRQQGKVVWMQQEAQASRACAGKSARHNTPLIKEGIKSSRIAELEEKHEGIHHDEPDGHGGKTHGRD